MFLSNLCSCFRGFNVPPRPAFNCVAFFLNIKLITFYLDAHPVHAVEDLLDGFIIP